MPRTTSAWVKLTAAHKARGAYLYLAADTLDAVKDALGLTCPVGDLEVHRTVEGERIVLHVRRRSR